MKSTIQYCSLALFICFANQLRAQDKIVIDDRTSILNNQIENLLQKKFLEKNLYLTNSVDIKNKCEYYFSSITKTARGFSLSVEDCDGKLLGSLMAGSSMKSASDDEKATIIFYNLLEIIDNPTQIDVSEYNSYQTANAQNDTMYAEHDSRYFFAPSALPLRERELYYNSVYFLLHDFQYGITDRLTIGMGTTIIGLPVYFTAKYSIPIQENSHIAFGDMLMVGTYGTNFLGNLAFATYTYGNSHNNISIGGGHLYFKPASASGESSSVVGNISGILRAGKHFYFLTENYLFNFQRTESAFRTTSLPDGTFIFQEGEYSVRQNIWYGLTGIRFVRKRNELVSWQLGFTHMLIMNSPVPAPYNSSEWSTTSFNEGAQMIVFPTFSFTRKFKL